jgi:hypothetical protein
MAAAIGDDMIWKSLLALVLGFFGGWLVTASAALWYMDKADIFDRDGGGAMGAFFILGPFGGAIIAIALAAVTMSRGRAKLKRAEAGLPPEPPSAGWRIWRAALSAVAAFLAAWFFVELNGPYQISDTARMLVSDGIPALIGLAAGIWGFVWR